MADVSAPTPLSPVPSERQLQWHELEFYGFLHFTINTFTNLEWGFGDESPELFNPTEFDADQIVGTAADAGMQGLILTCKHHDGFCLWPSPLTEHSVKNSLWRNGQGDVVREISDACRRYKLRFGVYLSPWDRNHPDYATPAYVDYYRKQLRELLTEYGPIFEVWHDGANGGDGWYGGANETRTIDKETYYGWPETWAMIRERQPEAVIFSDVGPDIRWCGNERGEGASTCWMTLNTDGWCPGKADHDELGPGHEDGDRWLPPEVDVSIRPGWFYHAAEDPLVKSVQHLLDIYYQSVGMSASLLLNLPPDRRGLIHELDVSRLRQFRAILDATFAENLAADAEVTANNTRGNAGEFAAANVLADSRDSYWATDDGVTQGTLELDLGQETTFNRVLVQEVIRLGQRVKAWSVDAEVGGDWVTIVEAGTIGYKRILRVPDTSARRVRIRIQDARECIALQTVGLYREPVFAAEPRIERNGAGAVSIAAADGVVIRFTTDGQAPTASSPICRAPFPLPNGGLVQAAVLATDNPEILVPGDQVTATRNFGMAKTNWSLISDDPTAKAAIDDDPGTIWESTRGPAELTVDLGRQAALTGFSYLPPQRRSRAGIVERYRFLVAAAPDTFGDPVAEGRFDNILNNPIEQHVSLNQPVTGRYVKFVALATADGEQPPAVAELNVFLETAES